MPVAILDRSQAPLSGQARITRFPTFERVAFGNGLQSLSASTRHVPLVALSIVAPAGGEHDAPGRAGMSTLVAGLLDEGTRNRSSEEIARHIEGLGGTLSTGADWDAAYLQIEVLAPQCGEALRLLAELVIEAEIPDAEVERLRRQRLAELMRRRADPSALADRYFARALYGTGPYGSPLIGDESATNAVTREECIGWFRRHYTPRGTYLIAVGDFDPDWLRAEAETAFAGWQGGAPPAAPALQAIARDGLAVQVVDHAGAAQTELRIGHVGVPKRHPDRAAIVVLNSILGGKFTSRINLNLRERRGWTYGASSRFADRRAAGPFVVSAGVQTANAGEATGEVLREIERMRHELVEPHELEDAKSFIIGVFPYQLQTNGAVAGKLQEIAIHDLEADHYEAFLRGIASATAEDVLRVAREVLKPEQVQVVAVGPGAELAAQFRTDEP